MVTTWDTDYGNRLRIECREDDYDTWESDDVKVSGQTTFRDENDPDNPSATVTVTDVWTPIPEHNPGSASYNLIYDGFNDGPRWTGFGLLPSYQ